MKRAVAIGMLVLILLNTAGYYLVFQGWKWHNALTWTPDETANEALIVKVPFAVPYANESDEWTPAQGKYEHEGKSYRIVKQKLTPDAVYIALVADEAGNRINERMADFAKTFSDKPVESKQNAKVFPSFIKEYVSERILVRTVVNGWSQTKQPVIYILSLVPTFVSSIVHPPERA